MGLIENENNLIKYEGKTDLTEVAKQAYDDGIKNPLKSSSNAVSTLLDFFQNTVLYPLKKYNLYAENKLQNYALELQSKTQSIPEQYLQNSNVNILGPAIEGLKYNLDEQHIKEMFTNILISDMDSRKKDKVLPSYIEIVKQLNKSDAELLKFFKENKISQEPIMKIKYIFENGGFHYLSHNLILILPNNYKILESIIIDNLLRLKIIEITFEEYSSNENVYQKTFEQLNISKDITFLPQKFKNFGYSKGILKLTDFGQNFIDICLS